MTGWAALLEPLTLIVAGRTGWSETNIHSMPVRRLVRYLNHMMKRNNE